MATPAQTKALESKALAASSKSDGMRSLFEAGYTVLQVRDLFECAYGFAYGVAVRGGFVTAEPREAKPKAEKAAVKTAPKAKAAVKDAKPAAKVAVAAKPAPRTARVARTGAKAKA